MIGFIIAIVVLMGFVLYGTYLLGYVEGMKHTMTRVDKVIEQYEILINEAINALDGKMEHGKINNT